ncbi:hypothetical protein [Psychrobacter frigidicola]|uniref:hypothetical protein n=1 Tax=Psychrobacter frigidicola TaxID=45611 RepID=UPI00191A0EB8|nr:hypothetical protein [Psychrobacter frigidicola]
MSNLLINEPPLQVLPSLAKKIGLSEAIALQQVHYWLAHAKIKYDGKMWIYKTFERWHEQDFKFWSERTIQRIFKNLTDMGLLLVEKLADNKQNRVNFYTIDYEKLNEVSADLGEKSPENTENKNDDKLSQCNTTDCHYELRQIDAVDNVNLASSVTTDCRDVKENKQETNNENIEENVVASFANFDSQYEVYKTHLQMAGVLPKSGFINEQELRLELYGFHSYWFEKKLSYSVRIAKLVNLFVKMDKERIIKFRTDPDNQIPLHHSHISSTATKVKKQHNPEKIAAMIAAAEAKVERK